ncbi:MAG: nucleotidyltransferase domain-containing protein [Elainellaceae cyanobacterium]
MPTPSADKLRLYIETARQRQHDERERRRLRRELGLAVAKDAADVLRNHFGVSQVVLFGSALDVETFHEASDIDLAVWGLPPKDYVSAVAHLLDFSEFSIDLVLAERADPYLQEAIAKGCTLGTSTTEMVP